MTERERMRNYGRLIQRIARRLHKLDEKSCNVPMNDKQEASHEKRIVSLILQARAEAEPHGFQVYHQGDPRGCSLYLVKPEDLRGLDIESAYDRGLSVYCW